MFIEGLLMKPDDKLAIFIGWSLLFSATFLLVFPLNIRAQESKNTDANQSSDSCDFSAYSPLKSKDFLPFAAVVPVNKVTPPYPVVAKQSRIEGKVEILMLINRKGGVTEVCAFEGNPLFISAARKAALKWKFKLNSYILKSKKYKFVEHQLSFNFHSSTAKPKAVVLNSTNHISTNSF